MHSTTLPLLSLALVACAHAGPVRVTAEFPTSALNAPFSGRVVAYFTQGTDEPRFGPNWFRPEPCFSAMFKNVKPSQWVTLDDSNTVGYPGLPSTIKPGQYKLQVVFDRNLGGRSIGASPGNLYSEPVAVTVDSEHGLDARIVCKQVITEPKFVDTAQVKEVRLKSKLLSAFYHRDTFLTAAVALPEDALKDPKRKFPIYYDVPGFGGNHMMLSGAQQVRSTVRDGVPFITVVLNPDCPTGHSVFADSANNGPWGAAVTTELIPEIEHRFPAVGTTETRFVGGHSSGGWSSLWLQVTYPNVFGGCWSTSPDPIDFRDFQQFNMYDPRQNFFTDPTGNLRPVARQGTKAFLYVKPFFEMEEPIRGEQMGSFEAVFGPRGKDGEIIRTFNRKTGSVNPVAFDSWKKYDIGLKLRTQWTKLSPQLAGKIHVYTGDIDTFYLEGAVKLVKADMAKLGANATFEIVPGDHFTMMTPKLRTRINHEMAMAARKAWPVKN